MLLKRPQFGGCQRSEEAVPPVFALINTSDAFREQQPVHNRAQRLLQISWIVSRARLLPVVQNGFPFSAADMGTVISLPSDSRYVVVGNDTFATFAVRPRAIKFTRKRRRLPMSKTYRRIVAKSTPDVFQIGVHRRQPNLHLGRIIRAKR